MQRIALIEDDAIVRQATSQWLQLAGFDVTAFEVGQDALNAVEQGDFQTIITDVRLPDIDGVELLARFKQLVPEVPVILITGHGDVDMAVKALQQGAYDFIESHSTLSVCLKRFRKRSTNIKVAKTETVVRTIWII